MTTLEVTPRQRLGSCPRCGGYDRGRISTCPTCDRDGRVVWRDPTGEPAGALCPSYAPSVHAGALDAPSARSCGGCARRPTCPAWMGEEERA
jgi:hypothetical protein